MTAIEFKTSISLYFDHFLKLFGFPVPAKFTISGRLYDATYEKNNKLLSISYEPGDEYLEIMLFEKNGDKLSDYDDRSVTKSLSDLNKKFSVNFSDVGIKDIVNYFNGMKAVDAESKQLKKRARELNFCFYTMDKLGKL